MNLIDLLFDDYKEYPKEDGYGISELYDSKLWGISEFIPSALCCGAERTAAKRSSATE